MTKNQRIALWATVAVIALAGLGYGLIGKNSENESRAAPPAKAAASSFRPNSEQRAGLRIEPVVSRQFVAQEQTDGYISVNEATSVNVFSPFSGRVSSIQAKLGEVVKRGAPLMTVEASEVVQAQNDLVAALATLGTAKSQLRIAELNEKRQHDMFEAKAGALKDWQQAQAELAAAQSGLRTAEIGLNSARNRFRILGRSEQDLSQVEEQPASRLKPDSVVHAPISGTVVQRQVGLGQFIQSASAGAANPVFVISDLSTVWLIANLREADAGLVKLGQRVQVRTLAYPDRVFQATITWISPSVDPNTHRIPVRAEIANADGALKPQMYARFAIIAGAGQQALAVPQQAVIYEGDSARVFVENADGSIAARSVSIGHQDGDQLEVLKGLNPGDKVVTAGAIFIDRVTKGTP